MSHDAQQNGPIEPGHRYQPRQVRPRVFHDVRRPAAQQALHLTPAQISPVAPKVVPGPPAPKGVDITSVVQKVEPQQSVKQTRDVVASKPAVPRQKRSVVLKRQMLDGATFHQRQQRQERRRQVSAFLFGGIAAAFIVTIGAIFYVTHFVQHAPEQSSPATLGAVTVSSDDVSQVSEAPISTADLAAFKANDGDPRILRIPKLQLVARVMPVKAALNDEPLRPTNIYDAGWLISSGRLGDTSRATLIDGNVTGPTKDGIFRSIASLGVGDEIKIDKGNSEIVTYKVVQSKQYDADKVNMAEALRPVIAGRPGLNLLSCTGRFNVKTNQFEKRTIIFASQQ